MGVESAEVCINTISMWRRKHTETHEPGVQTTFETAVSRVLKGAARAERKKRKIGSRVKSIGALLK